MELYRRHTKDCPKRKKGIGYTRCTCPVWVDGANPVTGERVRRSLETRDWARAQQKLEKWESELKDTGTVSLAPTVAEAADLYMKDCRARNLAPSSLRTYEKVMQHFVATCKADDVSGIRVRHITEFRNERSEAAGRKGEHLTPLTIRKELEAVRAFCEFAVSHDWLPSNPARRVKSPRDTGLPTMPFSPDEVSALLTACGQISNNNEAGIERARLRARALVLLLLYSGLRISDAIKLERARVDSSGRLMIRMMKTGEPLYVRLRKDALDALAKIPAESEYFFWSGNAKLSTAVGSARRTIDCLGRLAGINAHPHRFRDTFSVELLKSGADLRTVQLLLGHTSIKTTEKHYAPWVSAFQARLDKATSRLRFTGPAAAGTPAQQPTPVS